MLLPRALTHTHLQSSRENVDTNNCSTTTTTTIYVIIIKSTECLFSQPKKNITKQKTTKKYTFNDLFYISPNNKQPRDRVYFFGCGRLTFNLNNNNKNKQN